MIVIYISRLSIIALILTLSACAGGNWGVDPRPLEAEIPFPAVTEDPFPVIEHESRFYINGVRAPLNGLDLLEIKSNPEEKNRFIDRLINIENSIEVIPNRDRFLTDLADIFESDSDSGYKRKSRNADALKVESAAANDFEQTVMQRIGGVGGFQVRTLLHYMLACSDEELAALEKVHVVGKIEKWIYKKSWRKGSGYIYWHADVNDCKNVSHDFKFHIAVNKGYELLENIATEPYHLDFGDQRINNMIPIKEREILIKYKRQFNYKLHAQGNKIHILTVFLDDNLVDANDPVYTSDPDSCIDIFFKEKPPANELPRQFGYCMGRCDHPPILNTSGD